VLGLAWLHGRLHATAFRRHQVVASWSSPASVRSLEDLADALDDLLRETGYAGTEAFLVLAHEAFLHQLETVPAFSDRAARTYLRSRVERLEREQEPMLWVAQRALTVRKEHAHLLHLLPGSFYYDLNEIFIARRLELARILPLLVPMQLELAALESGAKTPVLLAAEAGEATAVMAGIPGGDVMFSRTTLASWADDPGRVAVEINRSLLYAKQQFGANVERAWLAGTGADKARGEVETRCGSDKRIDTRAFPPEHWLQLVDRLSPSHPINLVAVHLRKRRRNRWIRTAAMAACWLVCAWVGLSSWNARESWAAERESLERLDGGDGDLTEERERLLQRNAAVARDRETIDRIVNDRLPPVPGRFLANLAQTFPREARLLDFNLRLDENGVWVIRIEGEIEADEETARIVAASLGRQLARGAFRVRLHENARPASALSIEAGVVKQRFSLEGGLFEN
jgi:hypothetical protein